MRLLVIPKLELSAHQYREATERIFSPDNMVEVGPRYLWNRPEHDHRHHALFDAESEDFVGTLYCVIIPPVAQDFTWWIDTPMRRKGYWKAMADDVARFLKKRHRIEKIGFIVFGGQHRSASQKIAQRLREHFDKPWPARASPHRGV